MFRRDERHGQASYGIYRWWPAGQEADWVHPDDRDVVRRLIPSRRILRRLGLKGRYVLLAYGRLRLRIKPILYLPVDGEGFDVGDRVEVRSRMAKNRPFVGTIREMLWDDAAGAIVYRVSRAGHGQPVATRFRADDLQQLERKETVRSLSAGHQE